MLLSVCSPGLVLNPDPESDSEDSDSDLSNGPRSPSPEMDDVKGGKAPLICLAWMWNYNIAPYWSNK